MTTLAARRITRIYRTHGIEVRAVDDVSLEVPAGTFVALVGPSGSGKTTMLALLAGLLQPDAGEVLINGRNLATLRRAELAAFRLANIGFTFQANNLVPYLTVRENVELMLRLNGALNRQGRKRALELLERLGLGERLNNLPGQLSGGQQQRVAIARALVHAPSIVLADEPTASLDTARAHQVVATLSQLVHEQGRAGIMVTHDLRMCAYADLIVQLEDGRLRTMLSDPDAIAAFVQAAQAPLAQNETVSQ